MLMKGPDIYFLLSVKFFLEKYRKFKEKRQPSYKYLGSPAARVSSHKSATHAQTIFFNWDLSIASAQVKKNLSAKQKIEINYFFVMFCDIH
jgi:hypothetical protein